VAFRKTVFAETFDLAKQGFREFARIAARQHPADKPGAEFLHAALAPPRRHGTAQFIRLAARETRRDHGDLHDLFLENRHA
jgi:hypothetical protein